MFRNTTNSPEGMNQWYFKIFIMHFLYFLLTAKIKIKQGQCKAWRIPSPKNLTFDLECSQGCYAVKKLNK
jgi:hypothetical protein